MAEMQITTVIGCKNRCTSCPQDKLIKAYAKRSNIYKMTFDTFEQCLDKIPLHIHIHFSGMAEKWLNPECTRMLLYAHEKGYEIAVYTTAVGMTPLDVEKIESIPFRIFSVHLPDKERYSKIEVSDNYLETIGAISKSKIQNREYMTMGTLPSEVRRLLKKRIAKTSMLSRAENIEGKRNVPTPTKLKGPIRCLSCSDLLNHNVLLPNGEVLLCCMDYGMKHILGNLLSVDYASLFENEEYQQLQKGLNDDSLDILCRYCENASTLDEYKLTKKKNMVGKVKKYVNRFLCRD
jgi:hypothetical protein